MGYSDPNVKHENKGGVTQWRAKGNITEVDTDRELLHYNIDTNSGIQVGSGIFYEDEHKLGKFYVIGVHLGKNSAPWISDNNHLCCDDSIQSFLFIIFSKKY